VRGHLHVLIQGWNEQGSATPAGQPGTGGARVLNGQGPRPMAGLTRPGDAEGNLFRGGEREGHRPARREMDWTRLGCTRFFAVVLLSRCFWDVSWFAIAQLRWRQF